ncbi:hypothetical protein [Cysteiniphilum sp. 6C5]|uniref:hypothetical protein n=1 Tax=unclassified Cysteiniphilum TaxID=2610889 RepID=UPI003F83BE38
MKRYRKVKEEKEVKSAREEGKKASVQTDHSYSSSSQSPQSPQSQHIHLPKLFKRYALGCDYHHVTNKKAFLKEYGSDYGYFNAKHNQAVVTKLKSHLNKSLLSLLIASEFRDFLYITDQHGDAAQVESADGQMLPLFWICLVQHGRVVDSGSVYTNQATGEDQIYSGDMFISCDRLPLLIHHLANINRGHNEGGQNNTLTVSMNCSDDISGLFHGFPEDVFYLQVFDIQRFLADPKVLALSRKYLVRPVKGNSLSAKIALVVLTAGLIWYGVDKYLDYKDQEALRIESMARAQQQELHKKQLRIQKSKTFIGLVNQNNANYVLLSVIARLSSLQYLVEGWDLTAVNYDQQRVGVLRLTYQRNQYATLDGFIRESNELSPLKMDVDKDASKAHVDVAIMSRLSEPNLTLDAFNHEQNRLIAATKLLSVIQSYSLTYVASQATVVDGRKIQTIQVNGLGDYTLLALAQSAAFNPYFIISDLKLSIHDSMITNWSFKGVIYE